MQGSTPFHTLWHPTLVLGAIFVPFGISTDHACRFAQSGGKNAATSLAQKIPHHQKPS
jgi:hypothetical protein